MATDPICGMYVDERESSLRVRRENRTYYFCSTGCVQRFTEPGRELARLRRQLLVGWIASGAALVLTYGGSPEGGAVALAVLATVVQGYLGYPFYRGTIDAVRSRIANMDVLIAVGTTTAYLYSLAILLRPGGLVHATYFDASTLILTLILTGNYLEHLTRDRATSAVRRLGELLPPTAHLVVEGRESDRPAGDLRPGQRFRVRAGERVPADGTVRAGASEVDESLLTGESLPVRKAPGSAVVAGALNGNGTLDVEATGVGEDTFLARIGRLLAEAETSRVPLQRLADRIAAGFVPFVLALGVAAALGWLLIGAAGPSIALLVFVSVVITACPCAFGLATPAAIVVGTGRAARDGVLFRGHAALENAARVDLVLTDKTGTLTRGRPRVTEVLAVPPYEERRILALAVGLEEGSAHPLAEAVRAEARARGVPPAPIGARRAEPGRGQFGVGPDGPLALVRGDAADPAVRTLAAVAAIAARAEREGLTYSLVLSGGSVLGALTFADTVAPGAREGVAELRRDGLEVVMVTGDHEAAARRIAAEVGIREVRARVGPAEKLALVRSYRDRGRRVAFVGDGVNDAAALEAADVGIAIGTGTEVAREAGQILLVRPEFSGVPLALRIARRTVAKVRQNLLWALGYNAVLLPLAAGALVPWVGLGAYAVLPIAGAAAMALSSTLVLTNSLSLRWVRLGTGPAVAVRAARPAKG
jgi:P-type Cu+ transporter